MAAPLTPEMMAMRVAQEFANGDVINLGVGMPAICCDYVRPDVEVILHSEQGLLGFGRVLRDPALARPGIRSMAGPVEPLPGMSFMSHDESFCLVNSGRLDITVLGALQVDRHGNLANYLRPGHVTGSIGGAGDLATHARRTIVMMTHTTRGEPKVMRSCSLPLTAQGCVDLVVTDLGVMRIADGTVFLEEYAPGWTFEAIRAVTDADLVPGPKLREMTF